MSDDELAADLHWPTSPCGSRPVTGTEPMAKPSDPPAELDVALAERLESLEDGHADLHAAVSACPAATDRLNARVRPMRGLIR